MLGVGAGIEGGAVAGDEMRGVEEVAEVVVCEGAEYDRGCVGEVSEGGFAYGYGERGKVGFAVGCHFRVVG